jgi:hypothetical protein
MVLVVLWLSILSEPRLAFPPREACHYRAELANSMLFQLHENHDQDVIDSPAFQRRVALLSVELLRWRQATTIADARTGAERRTMVFLKWLRNRR